MPAPVITFTDSTSSIISSLSFGNVDASSTSAVAEILVWNNKGGGSTLSNATSVTLTSKTYNGLDTGDTIPNGQQIVSSLLLGEQCVSQGDSGYTQVGGPTTAPIGSSAGGTGTILGRAGGDAAFINLTMTAPSNVTAGPAAFLIRVSYVYS
jgi:hypothetical protein